MLFNKKEYNLPGGVIARKVQRKFYKVKRYYLFIFLILVLFYYYSSLSEAPTSAPNLNEINLEPPIQPVQVAELNPVRPENTDVEGVQVTDESEKQETEISKRVEDLIANYQIVIFSKSYCPYCKKAKAVLLPKSENKFVLELDLDDDGAKIQKYLLTKTHRNTVPNIFINQKNVGGLDELDAMIEESKLDSLLNSK
ncbi:thioredoxin-like protein [Neoconidiobolus thromboides FSU 785]|nr:thioredoxin-like protein [Neoconidiobolus thromboides FSU 785]